MMLMLDLLLLRLFRRALPGLTSEPELSTGLKLSLSVVHEALIDAGILLEHAQHLKFFGLGPMYPNPGAVLGRLAVL